jgi:hypothetical protein
MVQMRVRFSRELHKKYLPMRLQQMKLKNLNKRLQNKKIIMNPIIATSEKSKDLPNLKGMSGMDGFIRAI